MPFYEYQCAACGHHHEELQKVSDRALRKCPACGRPSLKRLLSAPVFRLKGAGWYETDFKNDKEAKRNIAGEKDPAPEAPAASASADGKADAAKPSAKEAPEKKASTPASGRPVSRKPRRASKKRITGRGRRR